MPSGTAQFGFLLSRIAFSVPDRNLDLSGGRGGQPPEPRSCYPRAELRECDVTQAPPNPRDESSCLALELFELNALHLHQDDQALELGALHVIAGSGVEIQGYARGDRTESRQIRSEV
jgi:hypothetical protein